MREVNRIVPRTTVQAVMSLLGKRRRVQAILLVGLMLIAAFAEFVTVGAVVPLLTRLASLGSETGPQTIFGWAPSLTSAAIVFALAALAAAVIRLLLLYAMQRFGMSVARDLSVEVQRRILMQPYTFHLRAHSSELLAAQQKASDLPGTLLLPLLNGAAALLMSLFILAALVVIGPPVALAAVGVVAVLYALTGIAARRRLAKISAVLSKTYEARIRLTGDALGSIRDLILEGSQARAVAEYRRLQNRIVAEQLASGLLHSAPRLLVEAVGMILIVGLAMVLVERGGIAAALPVVGALALGAQRMLPLVQQLFGSWTALGSQAGVVADIDHVLQLPVPPLPEGSVEALPFASEVRLRNVEFAYPGQRGTVLHDVSLVVPKGSRIALTGPTGSGKSTLADLLMGLLTPSAGEMLVDGAVLDADTLPRWRRNVAHVPQALFVVDASVAENIAFGVEPGQIDADRVARAVEVAQLDGWIRELPQGYRTIVGERGSRLSGGQRQRLAIARAVYRNAPLLVLDEATSALDRETEAALLQSLEELQRAGTTIVIIAHRRSTLAGCDRVVRLESGRIVGIDGPA